MNQLEINGEEVVFGLDIGTRNVVGTLGYKSGDRFVVVAQEIREHQTRAMLDGSIHDISRVAETIKEIKLALEDKTGLQLKEVCIAAAGRVLKTMNVNTEYKLDKEREVTKDDINTLVSMGIEQAFSEFQKDNDTDIHFYCVGYSVVKYYINGLWIGQPEHHKARKLGADIIATFLPDDVVDGLYSAVELADLSVAGLTLEPIAAIRVAIPEKFRLLNIAMIDIGAGTSDISITNEGSVVSFGMIPYAGDCLTETLAKECLVDFGTAEHIKTAAFDCDEITYEDIMGLEQSITSEEVVKICQPAIDKMAHLAAEEIKRLNGGESTSAVFIVGGGGKIKGFTDKVAEELGLDPKRVALRGEEIMKDIDFPSDALKDSTIITPIGICLTYYDQNSNFVYVTFNGEKVKLYDNNKLTVMDAAMQASFTRDGLFARKGEDLRYTLNGKRHSIRGEFGEPAHIFINDAEVTLNQPIRPNDRIKIEAATVGKSAVVKISDIAEYNNSVNFVINGDDVTMPVLAMVNGDYETGDYQIKNGDRVEIPSDYTLEKVVEFMGLAPDTLVMTINGNDADLDYRVRENDVIELNEKINHPYENAPQPTYTEKEPEKTEQDNYNNDNNGDVEAPKLEQAVQTSDEPKSKPQQDASYIFQNMNNNEENGGDKLLVIVNDKPVVMSGKTSYAFVDVFDYIDFDTSKMQGKGIATIVNGKDALYTQPLHAGDKIEIYWRK
jgi:cell division protein FtsA